MTTSKLTIGRVGGTWASLAILCMCTNARAQGPASPATKAEDRLPPVSDRARKVHAAGMLFDGHNDLPWRLRTDGDFALNKFDLSRRLDSGHTDIPRLREGGVKAQFWSVYIPSEHAPPGADGHRADRPGEADGRALSRCLRDGVHRRRRRADRALGQGRLADRDRGRRGDRGQPGPAPRLPRAGRPIHDAHPQHDAGLGRRRDRHTQSRRPEPLRRAGGQGDEPPGDAGGHRARLARHHGRRPARLAGPDHRQPFQRAMPSARPPATSPTTSSRPSRRTAASSW